MKDICEICKRPFRDEDLIDLRQDQYVKLLMGTEQESSLYDLDYKVHWLCVCEPCYNKYAEIEKEFENFPPSLLKHRFPSIDFIKEDLYRSEPTVNMTDDRVRVVFSCSRYDWNKMKHEFKR